MLNNPVQRIILGVPLLLITSNSLLCAERFTRPALPLWMTRRLYSPPNVLDLLPVTDQPSDIISLREVA